MVPTVVVPQLLLAETRYNLEHISTVPSIPLSDVILLLERNCPYLRRDRARRPTLSFQNITRMQAETWPPASHMVESVQSAIHVYPFVAAFR